MSLNYPPPPSRGEGRVGVLKRDRWFKGEGLKMMEEDR